MSDNQTIQYAKQLRISKSDGKKIRYILKTIYDLAFGNEMIVNSNTQYVNLEHILPQNPKEDSTWLKTFDKKTLDDYINSLGNLTLILGKKNSSLGNKEFYEKRVLLKESKISQNHEIADNDSWGKKEIEDRTEYLANKIIQIWKKN
ncbi:HNH endonuclease family protein [Staphylococcus simulans]|uniref:HNH endonuclease family protein n=1 Tax=Staphylococcus simulans TaxID=1286 RepID=UPI00217535C5|nr:HNH endonuclease family protein [Staphylococcus simulans]